MIKDSLTFADLIAAWDKVFPPLYYATMDDCERGKVNLVKPSEYHPEYIVFHPDDFEEIKQTITDRRLVHLRDYSPDTFDKINFIKYDLSPSPPPPTE